jgi:signal peptidase I
MMEWLANLSIQWVLIAIGLLLVARQSIVRTQGRRLAAATACEFIEAALVAIVVVFLVVRPFLFQAYFIPSESMLPTLKVSDRILVNKLIYRLTVPKRKEIIVFRPPEELVPEMKDYIKRVIGLPGETIEVVPPRLLVDGQTLMRLTDESASDVMADNFDPRAEIGFTYPLNGGDVILDEGSATVSSGLEQDLTVRLYRPGDTIEVHPNYVYLNDEPVLAVALGPISVSRDLSQWGGDRDLAGFVYSVNGNPRLILARGKRLATDDGHVQIDGRRLDEPYIADDPKYAMAPLRVPPDHYFMMGDNRNASLDSHRWGPLPADHVIGRAGIIFWPAHRFRIIHAH